MNNQEFQDTADQLMEMVENHLEQLNEEHDIDYDQQGNVLNIIFENGSHFVINRQTPFKQIWLATPENGYHFNYQDDKWVCSRSQQDFWSILNSSIEKQLYH